MAAYSQLTHLLAARLEPGERELTNQDLRLIFGLVDVTDAVRAEIADDLRDAGVEVLGLDPLLVRKPAPEPVEAPPVPPKSRTPWLIAAGVVAAFALLFTFAPRGGTATQAVAPVPTLKIRAHATGTPGHGRKRDATREIRPAEIAPARTPKAELPCDTAIRSECEPRGGTGGRARRGR